MTEPRTCKGCGKYPKYCICIKLAEGTRLLKKELKKRKFDTPGYGDKKIKDCGKRENKNNS
jgi:hypothetical protein